MPFDSLQTPAEPHTADRSLHVLVLDDEPDIREVLSTLLTRQKMQVHHAESLRAARALAQERPIDIAVIDLKLPDGNGLEIARELSLREPAVPCIVLAGQPTFDDLAEAMRAGACDYLAKPFTVDQLNQCVDRAIQRRRDSRRLAGRVQRLRRVCRKLNKARLETTQQVDVLCNDLVSAYHELADRFKHVQMTSRYQAAIEPELSLEQLLHHTLDFILQQVGSTNAAIFLPGQESGFTTSGYVNYTFDKDAASIILPQLAEHVAPQIVQQEEELVHLRSDEEIDTFLEGEMANLDGSHVVTLACRHDDETLAGICLFRDADQPFDVDELEALAGIAPILARQLVRVIRVHHRLDFDDDE
ncbi:MAG: response regulator [Phycisphaeraceae bacterium]